MIKYHIREKTRAFSAISLLILEIDSFHFEKQRETVQKQKRGKYLDELDKKLLNLLQQNGRLSIKKLSEALFITAPAVSQRIKHLEETEQLLYYQAAIDYEQPACRSKHLSTCRSNHSKKQVSILSYRRSPMCWNVIVSPALIQC